MEGMKPLNEVAKKRAISNFIGIYGLSLLGVLLMSFFVFKSPVKILKDEVNDYTALKVQHNYLVNKLNAITTQITDLVEVGKVISKNPDSGLDTMMNYHIENINKAVSSLKFDFANRSIPFFKEDLTNYLAAYNAVLFFCRNKNDETPILSPDINNGNETNNINKLQISKLQSDKDNLNIEIKKLIEENKRLRSSAIEKSETVPDVTWQMRLNDIEKERDNYKNQVAGKSEELRAKDAIIKDKEDLIKECNKKLINQPIVNTEEKSKVYLAVDEVIKKSKLGRKGVFIELRNILLSVRNIYPQKAQLDKKVNEIDILMRDF